MDRAEGNAFITAQEDFLHQFSAETPLTVELIRQMHALWLGSIYIWAGSYRTVEMAKGGFVWPPARLVAQNMEAFQKRTLQRLTPCRAKNAHELAIALAEVQSEFLLVHPFREGNGRSARWMTDLMAMQTGRRPLEYVFSGRGGRQNSKTYLQGVIQGYAGNYEPLADFLEEAITRADLRALREDNFNPRAPSK
jgi:cell filamentation protein